jgi:hypothetical protein
MSTKINQNQNDEANNSNFKSLKEDNCDDNFNGIDSDYIHYFYKITNKINGKYYYGIHSIPKSLGKDPLYDGYLGSGTEIRLAIQNEGRENFEKEIIEIFETREGARLKEAEVVTIDLISNPLCYNRTVGGGYSNIGKTVVILKDNPEKILLIDQKEFSEHPEKYIGVGAGSVTVKRKDDPSNKWIKISKEEYYQNKDQYVTTGYGVTQVVDLDENGNPGKEIHTVPVEEYKKYRGIKYISAGYLNLSTDGKVVVIKKDDPNRNAVIMDKTDPRYLSGEYVGVTNGLKQSEETKRKRMGEKNGSYGSMWITNGVETKKSYDGIVPDGWRKGRTYKIETLNKMTTSNREKTEGLKITTTVFSKKDNKNISVKLNRSFFKDRETESELITYEYLVKLKKDVKFWTNVSKHLKISMDSLIKIIKFYESLGYSFNSKEPSNP